VIYFLSKTSHFSSPLLTTINKHVFTNGETTGFVDVRRGPICKMLSDPCNNSSAEFIYNTAKNRLPVHQNIRTTSMSQS